MPIRRTNLGWPTLPHGRGRAFRLLGGAGLAAILLTTGAAPPNGPEQTLRRQLRSCPPDDAPAMLEVARYAIEHDLPHADDVLRDVLHIDPANDAAYELLIEQSAGATLGFDSAAYSDARKRLPSHFRKLETRHFVLLTDADPVWARAKGAELERTHDEFFGFCRQLGLRPHPLRHKLVCVLFADRAAYAAFAREHDAVEESWIAGYYAPLGDRVVIYDVRSSPGLREAAGELDAMHQELLDVKRQAREARNRGDRETSAHFASLASTYESHLDGERDRVEQFTQRVSTATVLHESTHQLLFHTRVQHPRVQYPLWISEGLACAFESADPRHSFGPQHKDPHRLAAFQIALRAGDVTPLRDLIQITELAGSGESSIEQVYHQCAALVAWMHRARRDELRTYLELMLAEPAGRPTCTRHMELFEQAFGDVEQLEAAWLKHERSNMPGRLATP